MLRRIFTVCPSSCSALIISLGRVRTVKGSLFVWTARWTATTFKRRCHVHLRSSQGICTYFSAHLRATHFVLLPCMRRVQKLQETAWNSHSSQATDRSVVIIRDLMYSRLGIHGSA